MLIPRAFAINDPDAITRIMLDNPLATVIASLDSGLEVHHLPFVVEQMAAGQWRLRAHIPRVNALASISAEGVEAKLVFQGAHGYVSPSWYATKAQHGRVVPTWNYAAVHVHGVLKLKEDPEWVRGQLEDLTFQQEKQRPESWGLNDAPAEYLERQISALVGLEMCSSTVEAKLKASQNQPRENQLSVLDALEQEQPNSDFTQMMRDVLVDG